MTSRANTFVKPELVVWCITHGTKDFGDSYVVREHRVYDGVLHANLVATAVCDTLMLARSECVKAGAVKSIGRESADDAVIVESWI